MTKARAYRLKKVFGITEEQYDELLKKQGGRCAICGQHESKFKMKLAVDHNHHTGRIRGLLCFICNKFIVGTIDRYPNRILPGIKYVESPGTEWFVPKQTPKRRK